MRLEPLYTVTFRTPEAWSVEVVTDAGIEGRSFLLVGISYDTRFYCASVACVQKSCAPHSSSVTFLPPNSSERNNTDF